MKKAAFVFEHASLIQVFPFSAQLNGPMQHMTPVDLFLGISSSRLSFRVVTCFHYRVHKHDVRHLFLRSCIRLPVPQEPESANSAACATQADCNHWPSSLDVHLFGDLMLFQERFLTQTAMYQVSGLLILLLPCSSRRQVLQRSSL